MKIWKAFLHLKIQDHQDGIHRCGYFCDGGWLWQPWRVSVAKEMAERQGTMTLSEARWKAHRRLIAIVFLLVSKNGRVVD